MQQVGQIQEYSLKLTSRCQVRYEVCDSSGNQGIAYRYWGRLKMYRDRLDMIKLEGEALNASQTSHMQMRITQSELDKRDYYRVFEVSTRPQSRACPRSGEGLKHGTCPGALQQRKRTHALSHVLQLSPNYGVFTHCGDDFECLSCDIVIVFVSVKKNVSRHAGLAAHY